MNITDNEVANIPMNRPAFVESCGIYTKLDT